MDMKAYSAGSSLAPLKLQALLAYVWHVHPSLSIESRCFDLLQMRMQAHHLMAVGASETTLSLPGIKWSSRARRGNVPTAYMG